MKTILKQFKDVLLRVGAILPQIKIWVKARFDIFNNILLASLLVLLLLVVNRVLFGAEGDSNYTTFISAAITAFSVYITIIATLEIQKRSAMKTFAKLVFTELSRNLSELEYADTQFKQDYTQQIPEANNATPYDKQTMEMSKIMGAAARLDAALEDTAYTGMISSGVIVNMDQALVHSLVDTYTSISTAKETTRHFADFFSNLLSGEKAQMDPVFIKFARKEKVDLAITMVNQDVSLAIKQVYEAMEFLNQAIRQYGQKYQVVYKDELLEKYGISKEKTNP